MGPKPDKVTTFKIYITNLPANMKNEDVGKLFEPYGRVVESEVFRGHYAFVHMEDDESGRRAIEEMNGKEVDEHVISVCQSKNLQGPKIATMKLAVKNIPNSMTAAELRSLFTKYGFVLEAEVRGENGHVLLEATGDIRSAINEVSTHEADGNTLKVEAVTNFNAPSTSAPQPQKSKVLGKRKEPAPGPFGPPGRNGVPPPYGMGPPPPPLRYPPYPPRRPLPGPPPGPPRMRPRPLPPPPMARPYYAGRPPPDFDQDSYDDRPPTFPRYHHPADDFSEDYDDSYYAQPPPPAARRPPPPAQYYEDEFYEPDPTGSRGGVPGLYSRPKRIARERPFIPPPSGPPRPLLGNGHFPSSREPPYRGREGPQDNFYNDYEPPVMPPRPKPTPNNASRPPPLLPPPPTPNPNVKTAKVTKFGKIILQGSVQKPVAAGKEKQKHRGVRGGVKAKARKAAAAAAAAKGGKKLPSLLDPIPGTVRVVGEQKNPLGGATIRPGPGARKAGPARKTPLRPERPPVPLMGPPLNPLGHPSSSKPKPSLLAQYHETKHMPQPDQHHLIQPMQYMAPPIKQDIDFTADIELP